MKDTPILMRPELVRASLDGRKDVTRRLRGLDAINRKPGGWAWAGSDNLFYFGRGRRHVEVFCPFGGPGDRLWFIQILPVSFGDGKYGVGDDGNVYDLTGAQPVRRKPGLSHNGYEQINLRHRGARLPSRVNRLVCEAFYGPASVPLIEVRHMDGNKRNNMPENLDWGTRKQNALDAAAAGVWSGERNRSRRLDAEEVAAIRAACEPQATLAARFRVTQPTISKIRAMRRWRQPGAAPPRNAPAWACRLRAEIVSVRPERVQDITEEDARREGFRSHTDTLGNVRAFERAWREMHGDSWDRNDWCWRIAYRRVS